MAGAAANWNMCGDRIGDVRVHGTADSAVESPVVGGYRGDRAARHGSRVFSADVGTAIHDYHQDGPDPGAGTSVRVGHLFRFGGGSAYSQSRRGRRTDFGRDLASGTETDWAS